MFTAHKEFNEALAEVLEKVGLLENMKKAIKNPPFDEEGECVWSAEVRGDKSHFVISLHGKSKEGFVSDIGFELIYYPYSYPMERWVKMLFSHDGTVYYDYRSHAFEEPYTQRLINEITQILKEKYQNPRVAWRRCLEEEIE